MIEKIEIKEFIDSLASKKPTPGGGSAAALAGSISSALIGMVAELTISSKKYYDVKNKILPLIDMSKKLRNDFLNVADLDIEAFGYFMECIKMSKNTEEEKEIRKSAIQNAAYKAARIPLDTMILSLKLCDGISLLAEYGNKNAISDVSVSLFYAETAFYGAEQNVLVNLEIIKDEKVREDMNNERESLRNMFKGKIENSKKLLGLVS